MSDEIREKLFDLGVLFEDRPQKSTLVKLIDAETVARMKAEQDSREAEKLARKLEMARINEAKLAQKLAKASIDPNTMFLKTPGYSKFDEQGIPTHDANGEELSKNSRKKVLKEFEAQVELYNQFANKQPTN